MFIALCTGAAVAPTADELRELRAHMELIVAASNLGSLEKLAVALEIDRPQLERQLSGEGHVSLTRIVVKLGMADPAFFPRYGWLIACRYGLPKETRIAADMDRAMSTRRVVGMDATRSQKRSA